MQVELKTKVYYVVDKTGYWIVNHQGTNKRPWFRTQKEADFYLASMEVFTICPNAPLSVSFCLLLYTKIVIYSFIKMC